MDEEQTHNARGNPRGQKMTTEPPAAPGAPDVSGMPDASDDGAGAESRARAVTRRFQRQAAGARWLDCRSYPDYVRRVWRSTAAFGWYRTARTLWRRYRVVRLIWRVVRTLLWMLRTGTLILLLLPVLLVFLPGFLLLSLLMLLGGALDLGRWRRHMARLMQGRTVVFLDAPEEALVRGTVGCGKENREFDDGTVDRELGKGGENAAPFFRAQVRALCERGDMLVIVRSPYLLSSRGLGGRGFFWMIRRERRNCYLTRSLGFFALRRTACGAAAEVIFVV